MWIYNIARRECLYTTHQRDIHNVHYASNTCTARQCLTWVEKGASNNSLSLPCSLHRLSFTLTVAPRVSQTNVVVAATQWSSWLEEVSRMWKFKCEWHSHSQELNVCRGPTHWAARAVGRVASWMAHCRVLGSVLLCLMCSGGNMVIVTNLTD